MNYQLAWDDDAQTIIRCEIRGFVGRVDWLMPINEVAGMALLSEQGKAHTIMHIPFFTFPFPNRPFEFVRQTIIAGHSYQLGKVVICAPNPITRALIGWKLMNADMKGKLYVVSTLAEARRLLTMQNDA
jgi:hypothetical protein